MSTTRPSGSTSGGGASMTDYSFDRIGERLAHPEREPVLAADDAVRVRWVLDRLHDLAPVRNLVDIGASDGAIARLCRPYTSRIAVIECHPDHRHALSDQGFWCYFGDAVAGLEQMPPGFWDTALLCEVLEHLTYDDAYRLVRQARRVARRVIVTVPNRRAGSYEAAGRARWDWPDHRQTFNAMTLMQLTQTSWAAPIVGAGTHDSIWLGTVIGT